MRRTVLILAFVSLCAQAQAQSVDLSLGDEPIASKTRLGIGVNGGGGWTNFVGAILVDDPSFEGAEGDNGFARQGWPWYVSGGAMTASVDTSQSVSGNQCQRVEVTQAPSAMHQGRTSLPQAPLSMQARTDGVYRIKLQIKSDTAGARIQLGVVNEGWQGVYGPEIAVVGTDWQVLSFDYVPESAHLLRGISIRFVDAATYWLDDLVAWDTTRMDGATGLDSLYVQRLKDLQPATLRLGGLGVNGIPLESYLRSWWDLDYGPPAMQPDMDLNTFLRLCLEVGAQPFITVPPAFSDDSHWQIGDLTDEVIADIYVDHGNLIDYLGGDSGTEYGARRQAAGFDRWDQAFEVIYFELGNELWGTPDDRWDMDVNGGESQAAQMENYALYCERRMQEMLGRAGWRANMRVGFCGRGPTMWMGGWPGSYDGTLVPAIGEWTDFSTIDLYYGEGAIEDGDAAIYGALFANAPKHEREINDMKAAFAAANGGLDIETTVYEGNATWGGYESDLENPSPLYFKEVSLGAAVSLVDLYAAVNRAGVTVNNHFHFGGNVWGACGPYPDMLRKPAYFALQLLNRHVQGQLVDCPQSGGTSWNDPLTGEQGVSHVACYPFVEGERIDLLLINRHLSEERQVRLAGPLAPIKRVLLSHADINANNEDLERVVLTETEEDGVLRDEVLESLPPHSAVVLQLSRSGQTTEDGGSGEDAGQNEDAGQMEDAGQNEDAGQMEDAGQSEDAGQMEDAGQTEDADPGLDGGADVDGPGSVEGSCGCSTGGTDSGTWLLLLLMALGMARRFRP